MGTGTKFVQRTSAGSYTVSLQTKLLPLWKTRLLEAARGLDEEADILLSNASTLNYGPFSSIGSLNGKLNEILSLRYPIRRLEVDVESFLINVSEAETEMDLLALTQQMTQLHHTYDRAFDLITMKINSWQQMHLALASLLVAAVAIIISIAK